MIQTLIFVLTFMLAVYFEEVESKYCRYDGDGYMPFVKYFYCSNYEYCCGGNCCTDIMSFYNLWYFWLVVILLLLFCAGGGFWYRRHYGDSECITTYGIHNTQPLPILTIGDTAHYERDTCYPSADISYRSAQNHQSSDESKSSTPPPQYPLGDPLKSNILPPSYSSVQLCDRPYSLPSPPPYDSMFK